MVRPAYSSLLVCPLCQGKLKAVVSPQPELWCTFHGLAFPIIDELPIMLETRARQLTTAEKLGKKTSL